MGLPDDFNKKTTVTISLLIWIAGVSFSMGMIYAKINDNEKEHAVMIGDRKSGDNEVVDFVIQEVGGLRADWERRNADVEKRLDKLEKK